MEGKTVALTGLTAKDGYPANLYEGSNINLKPYVIFNPAGVTSKELTWSVNDADYAEVNQYGRVTAKWKTGDTSDKHTVTVTATAKEDNTKTVDFTIDIHRNNVPLKALYVTPADLTLEDAEAGTAARSA